MTKARGILACHRSNPIAYNKQVSTTSETAFQRALYNNGISSTPMGDIEWLDIELPVDKERGGRGHCPDLLGKIGDRYVLCELKFNNHSIDNCPQKAKEEVMRYYNAIKANHEELDRFDNIHRPNGKHFYWKDFASKDVILMVVADKGYWQYWLKHRKVELPIGVECYSVEVESDEFKKQKGNKKFYVPQIQNIIWTKL